MSSESVDPNSDAVKVLSDDEVAEIEAQLERFLSALTFGEPARGNRYVESVDGNFYFEEHADNEFDAFDLLRQLATLCATVRVLRADNADLRRSVEEWVTHYNEVEAWRSQLSVSNTALREQLAHRTIELENESREMQKWNNRANQLAVEGQDLRQQLAQVTQEPLVATIDLLEQRRRRLGPESIPEYARTINFLQAIIDEKKKEYPPLRAAGSNHESPQR